jgi:putative restriction endonuclease
MPETQELVEKEFGRRMRMWSELHQHGGPTGVSPGLLRELGMLGGQQGIWVNKKRTGSLTSGGQGVTVGLLHTGKTYPDDLAEDGVLYHYPNTNRPPGRDMSEISATKEAGKLNLPVFVVTRRNPKVKNQSTVNLGWVQGWDDDAKLFLVSFSITPLGLINEEEPAVQFKLKERKKRKSREVSSRNGQVRFRFDVFKRYGPSCAVCDIDLPQVLEAAHLVPKSEDGTNHPMNGLVLCASHHKAFDAGLFCIEPETWNLIFIDLSLRRRLGIERKNIKHLERKPHPKAVEWVWKHWGGSSP